MPYDSVTVSILGRDPITGNEHHREILVWPAAPMQSAAPAESHAPAAINHPAHYHPGTVEAIDVIEAWGLGFCLGNVVKYIARAGLKGSRLEDLRKARWYLDREIARSEAPHD